MTDAEKDAAWRSLPESFKEEVKRLWELDELPLLPDYDSDSVAEGAAYILTELFGKHNLTASEEEQESKESAKHGAITIPVKAEYDDSIWLPYRMELTKELAVAAMSRKGCIDINELIDDVDGIVERLRG